MASRNSKTPRTPWTALDVQAHYDRQGKTVPQGTRELLESLGLGAHMRSPSVAVDPAEPGSKAKRKGVDVAPIVGSLRAPNIRVEAGAGPTLSLWFEGARMLTVNELFSIFQYRKHDTFRYKKAWRQAIGRAIAMLPPDQPRPYFGGPTRIWLYRRGRSLVDLDSLPTMFKYAIDPLRHEKILADDNPTIVVESRLLQERGEPAVAMRLEALPDWRPEPLLGLKERWFSPLAAPAVAP